MKRRRQESIFQKELRGSFLNQYPDSTYIKIPDMPRMPGLTRFIPEKPFDIIWANRSEFWAIETKAHTKHTAWPFDDVEPHQLEALTQWERNGGRAAIMVQIKYDRYNYAMAFSPSEFRSMRMAFARKSIPIKDMDDFGVRMMRQTAKGKVYWSSASGGELLFTGKN